EEGIRDATVTGVQTCALPIYTVGARRVEVVLSRVPVDVIRGIADGEVGAGKRPHDAAAKAEVRDRHEGTQLPRENLRRRRLLVDDWRKPEEECVAGVMICVLNQC